MPYLFPGTTNVVLRTIRPTKQTIQFPRRSYSPEYDNNQFLTLHLFRLWQNTNQAHEPSAAALLFSVGEETIYFTGSTDTTEFYI